MTVFQPNGPLISIGGAVLYTIGGLNPQRLSHSSEARFPAHPTPAGIAYQKTGLGARTKTIEAKTAPHVMGGLDAYAILERHHRAQSTVPFLRFSNNFVGLVDGLCVIETMDTDEERLHPFDGVGRIVDVTLGLVMLPMIGTPVTARIFGGL